jgi:hypothetical protein
VLSTLLNNVATLATFRPGADDAVLAAHVSPVSAAGLIVLPPRTCCWRLAVDQGPAGVRRTFQPNQRERRGLDDPNENQIGFNGELSGGITAGV